MKNNPLKFQKIRYVFSLILSLVLIASSFSGLKVNVMAANTSLTQPAIQVNSNNSITVESILTGGTENVSYYWFEYSTSPYFTSTTQTSRKIPSYNSMGITETISGLDLNYLYYVRAVAQVSSGHMRYSTATEVGENSSSSSGGTSSGSAGTVSLASKPTATLQNDSTASLFSSFTNYNASNIEGGFIYSSTDPNFTMATRGGIVYGNISSDGVYANLSGLDTGKTYYIKAFIDYNNGTSNTQVVSSSSLYYTHNMAGLPVVETNNLSLSGMNITAIGTLVSDGTTSVTDRGFVWSQTNSSPTISNNSTVASSTKEFSTQFAVDSTYSNVYVRAYAKNSSGYSYGDVISVSLSNTLPIVETYSPINISANSADVPIIVTYNGTSEIIGMGIVYSSSSTPTLENNSGRTTTSTNNYEATVNLTGLEKDTNYYVRSYATNSYGTSYGQTLEFTTTMQDSVITSEITDIASNSAVSGGTIGTNLDYVVKERGIVYSKDNEVPDISNSITILDSQVGNGAYSIEMDSLALDTKYYVRAFIRTAQGYEYGNVRTFTTHASSYISIKDVAEVTRTSAVISASISNEVTGTVSERGIVYSTSNDKPTVGGLGCSNRIDMGSSTGDYIISVDNLTESTIHYVRAYAKVNDDYIYSTTETFTTSEAFDVTIYYITATGTIISKETISVRVGEGLTSEDLSIPNGYKTTSTFENITINKDEYMNVTVEAMKNASSESQFIEPRSGYKFEPDEAITRLEVAKMIYELKGEGKTYTSTNKFTDVPLTHSDINAINFAYNMKYIQGYPDGTFLPDNNITRAEMTVILNTVFNLEPKNIDINLSDISFHWAKDYIEIAAQNGIISGYEDGTFNPAKTMTRAEATLIFSKADNRSLLPLGNVLFVDVPQDHFAFKYIMNASIPKQ